MNIAEYLSKVYDKEKNKDISIGLIFIFTGCLIILNSYGQNLEIGLPIIFVGLLVLIPNVLTPYAKENPGIIALKKYPKTVVWIYLKNYKRKISLFFIPLGGNKDTRIFICLDNGKKYRFPAKKDTYKITSKLQELCPHAAYGYSDYLFVLFKDSPKSLINYTGLR